MGELLDTFATLAGGAAIVAVFLAVLILLPIALIWCLNTLGIATASYGITEWLAAFLLTALFLGGSGGTQ